MLLLVLTLVYKHSWRLSNCVAGLVKQVVPLSLQNYVSHAKGDLPTAAAGRFHRVSLCERVSGLFEPITLRMYMKQRTKYFQLRLTPDEVELIRANSTSFSSVSHYIRSAITEYSNVNAKQRLEMINELNSFHRRFQNELSWIGSNLNQSVKRANELSVAGLLSSTYLQEVLMPQILETQETLNDIKRGLDTVTQKVIKLK